MESVTVKEEPIDDDIAVTDTNVGARNMPINIDIKEEKDEDSQPVIITPSTSSSAPVASSTGMRFGDWFVEAAYLDDRLPSNVNCPVCNVSCNGGRAFWSHYLETHWDSTKFNNFLCTGCCTVFGLDHTCSHPGETPWVYICNDCGCPKEKLSQLEGHIGKCAGGLSMLKMACSRCPQVLTSIEEFWKHYSSNHWNKNAGYLSLAVGQKGGDSKSSKIHLCLPCGAVVPVSMHNVHSKACHLAPKRIRCPDCPKHFEGGRLFLQHFRDTHWSPAHFFQLACSNCGHFSKVAGKCCPKPKWQPLCSFCGDEYQDHTPEFKMHRKTCLGILAEDGSSKIPRDCKECRDTFATPKLLATHVERQHPRDKFQPKCDFCVDEPAFDSGLAVWKHCLGEHKTEALLHRFLCKACGKAFKYLAAFFDHQVYDHCTISPPNFLCVECGHSCSSSEELSQHKADHADTISNMSLKDEPEDDDSNSALAQSGPMSCPEAGCGKSYRDLARYWTHYKETHWDSEKKLRFLCGGCGKVFESINTIMEHNIALHEGNATAYVLCPKCGEKFLDSDAMEEHQKLCSGPSVSWPQCDVCKRYVPDTACLLKHMMRFHPLTSMPCHICEEVIVCSTIEEHLKEHSTSFDGEPLQRPLPTQQQNGAGRPKKTAVKRKKNYAEDSEEDSENETEESENEDTENEDDEDMEEFLEPKVEPTTPSRRRNVPTTPSVATSATKPAAPPAPAQCVLCQQKGFTSWAKLEDHLKVAHLRPLSCYVSVQRCETPPKNGVVLASSVKPSTTSAASGEVAMDTETQPEIKTEIIEETGAGDSGTTAEKMDAEEGEDTEPMSDADGNNSDTSTSTL